LLSWKIKVAGTAGIAAGWQIAFEQKPVGGQPGQDQRRQGGIGAGHRGDSDAGFDGGPGQLVAGIGDGRGACVGYQRHAFAIFHALNQLRPALVRVVIMIGCQLCVDIVHGEQAAGDAAVFAGNHIGGAQDGDGALAQILGVADGGGDQIKTGVQR
jgi:hypothetical protein